MELARIGLPRFHAGRKIAVLMAIGMRTAHIPIYYGLVLINLSFQLSGILIYPNASEYAVIKYYRILIIPLLKNIPDV